MTMEMVAPAWMHRQITAAEYESWTEEQSAGIEIVDGMVVVSPSASKRHNRLARILANALDAAAGPDWNADTDFDVRLQDVPLTRSFVTGGAQVVLVTPRPSPLRSLASLPGVLKSFEEPTFGEEEFAAALASVSGPGVVVIDDADLVVDREAGGELSRLVSRGAERSLALVIAGDSEVLAGGFGGWHIDARRARRGCLTCPQSLPEGDLVGVRLTHAQIGHAVKPGRALLNAGDGNLVTVTVPSL